MRLLLALLLLLPAAAGAAPAFDPLRFFAGRTEGRGTLKIALTPRSTVVVHGRGRVADGALSLDQIVVKGDKAPRERRWTIRAVAPDRYAGGLSDVAGPVAGDVAGGRLHLHFRMSGGIVADQRIDLAPDGESAHNRMTFRKFGIVVGRLDETIRRVP